jgi:hypothetical protein
MSPMYDGAEGPHATRLLDGSEQPAGGGIFPGSGVGNAAGLQVDLYEFPIRT